MISREFLNMLLQFNSEPGDIVTRISQGEHHLARAFGSSADFMAVLGDECIAEMSNITAPGTYLISPASTANVSDEIHRFKEQCAAHPVVGSANLIIPVCSHSGAGHWTMFKVTVTDGLISEINYFNSLGGARVNRIANLKQDFINGFDGLLRPTAAGGCQADDFSDAATGKQIHMNEQRELGPWSCMDRVVVMALRALGKTLVTPTGQSIDLSLRAYANGCDGAANLRNYITDIIRARLAFNLDGPEIIQDLPIQDLTEQRRVQLQQQQVRFEQNTLKRQKPDSLKFQEVCIKVLAFGSTGDLLLKYKLIDGVYNLSSDSILDMAAGAKQFTKVQKAEIRVRGAARLVQTAGLNNVKLLGNIEQWANVIGNWHKMKVFNQHEIEIIIARNSKEEQSTLLQQLPKEISSQILKVPSPEEIAKIEQENSLLKQKLQQAKTAAQSKAQVPSSPMFMSKEAKKFQKASVNAQAQARARVEKYAATKCSSKIDRVQCHEITQPRTNKSRHR